MNRPRFDRPWLLPLAALLMLGQQAHADDCSGSNHCTEVSAFSAALQDFRTSQQGNNRRLTATLSIHNKTDRPLTLGYVDDSGLALDEHGNRYTVRNAGANAVRGIGVIQRNTFDPKFTLQPGERSDARLELNWYAAQKIAGVDFRLELALREIDPVAGNQYRLGREHALSFQGLRDGAMAAATPPANAAPVLAGGSFDSGSTGAISDPCAGSPRCHASGPFIAEITQIASGQKNGSNHAVRVSIRFRNISNQNLILAYQQDSGTMLDELGQRYTVDWRNTANVAGIGQSSRNKADPQFVLSPGESRTATFNYNRYVGRTQVGTVFNPDMVIEQLEILPSNQIRSVRDYNVSFMNIGAGGLDANQLGDTVNSLGEAGRQISEGLRSIFRKQ